MSKSERGYHEGLDLSMEVNRMKWHNYIQNCQEIRDRLLELAPCIHQDKDYLNHFIKNLKSEEENEDLLPSEIKANHLLADLFSSLLEHPHKESK